MMLLMLLLLLLLLSARHPRWRLVVARVLLVMAVVMVDRQVLLVFLPCAGVVVVLSGEVVVFLSQRP